MKILICGSRDWWSVDTVMKRLSVLPKSTIIIEGEARGADTIARQCAEKLGMMVIKMPADWTKYGKAAGPIRNRQMLDIKPDKILAFHDNIAESKGTKDCVTEARKRGIPVEVITGPTL